MQKHIQLVLATCAVVSGCQKDAEVRDPRPNDLEKLERQHAAWVKSVPRPSLRLVKRIDALLAQESCIGRLDRWARYYAYDYDMRGAALHTEIVDFHFEEAGTDGIEPGLHITQPNSWVNIDDRPINMALGDYDSRDGRIRIAFCGQNIGRPANRAGIDNMDTYFDDLKRRRAELWPTRTP